MVTPSAGTIITLRFPFSDLMRSKLRPSLILANAENGDWVLCQITSNPWYDPLAIQIDENDFVTASLDRVSYARPGKLFTAHETLFLSQAGVLKAEACRRVIRGVIQLLELHLPGEADLRKP